MRGPGYRHDLDVRRVWRCPICGKERRLLGDVTSVVCVCGAAMQLVGERRHGFNLPQPLVSRELTVAEFQLTEEELSRPLPAHVARLNEPAPEANPPAGNAPSGNAPAGKFPPRPPRKQQRRNDGPPPGNEPSSPAIAEIPLPPEPTATPPVSDPPLHDDGFGAGLDDAAP